MKIFRTLTGNALLLAALIFGTGGGSPAFLLSDPSRGNKADITNQPTNQPTNSRLFTGSV